MKILRLATSIPFAFAFLIMANDAFSATITEPLTVTISGGPFDGTVGVGSFSYDEVFLAAGDETLDPSSSLEIEVTIFGQTFTEADDIDVPDFPTLSFDSFVPSILDFIISESGLDGSNPVEIIEPGVALIDMEGDLTPVVGGGFGLTGLAESIPEPSSLLLGALASLGLLMKRKR